LGADRHPFGMSELVGWVLVFFCGAGIRHAKTYSCLYSATLAG
jgi:hypothetical protein